MPPSRPVLAAALAALLAPAAHAAPGTTGSTPTTPCVERPCVIPAPELPAPPAYWKPNVDVRLDERVSTTSVSAIDVGTPIPTDPQRLEPSHALEHRFRAGASVSLPGDRAWLRELRVELGADVLSGALAYSDPEAVLAYDPRDPSRPVEDLAVRKALVEWTTDVGRLSVGRTTSQWGLGVLANAAEEDPFTFGLTRFGHVVDRVAFTALPGAAFTGGDWKEAFPLFVSVAWDRLVRDDVMDRRDGDSGTGQVAALLYRTPELELGAYGVRREIRDAQGLGLDVLAADVYGAWRVKAGAWKLAVATEWAFIGGEGTWFRTPSQPEGYDLLQVGGVVRFEAHKAGVGARVEAGFAGADSRPYDDTLHGMTFASDYRVGLVLFPELQRRHTAIAAHHLDDPRFTGDAPVGFERLPSGGAVTQAMYVNPVVRFEPFENVALLGGVLLARAPRDVTDPYRTAMAGGAPTGPRGAASARDLGVELDAAASYLLPIIRNTDPTDPNGKSLAIEARLDMGLLLPGDAFDDAEGGSAAAVGAAVGQLRIRGTW